MPAAVCNKSVSEVFRVYMLSGFVIGILKLILVIVILAGMVVILLGIGIMMRKSDREDADAAEALRREVKSREEVISRNSVFRGFLHRPGDMRVSSHKIFRKTRQVKNRESSALCRCFGIFQFRFY